MEKEKKLYLTKQETKTQWNYIGDPLNPTTTLDTGLVTVEDKSEIKVDDFGAYITRNISNEPKQIRFS